MKRKHIILIFGFILLFVIVFNKIKVDYKNDDTLNIDVYDENCDNDESENVKVQTLDDKIELSLSQMSLREKIGQMLIISYWDFGYSYKLNDILTEVKPGGFILFNVNVGTYLETVDYISKIKSTANIPMFISIDQEGGRVQKIKNVSDVNVLDIPSMYELGKTGDTKLSYEVGGVVAEELSAFGVNLDYAPVLDIFSNPENTIIGDRAFGNDANTVGNMAIPFAKGMIAKNVIPVYKHFPGHGDTKADSHFELPVVTKTKEQLYESELLPFKLAIENGAEMIMVAHIALPNVTGDYLPATLSDKIINGILREELNFNGVVVTDAINMDALSDNYTLEQICSYSINAGVDMILMPTDPLEALNTIEDLVNNGTITEERINESVRRILLVKYSNNIGEESDMNSNNIGTQEHIDIINRIGK